jgi:hypothetical protein
MEQGFFSTNEQLKAFALMAVQEFISKQQPVKEEPPQNISSDEARKLTSIILWHDISVSKWTKDQADGKTPRKGKAGKWIIYDRSEIIKYAKSLICQSSDPVSEAVQKSAKKKLK